MREQKRTGVEEREKATGLFEERHKKKKAQGH